VGRTRDDAAGEAFDKVAKLLHLLSRRAGLTGCRRKATHTPSTFLSQKSATASWTSAFPASRQRFSDTSKSHLQKEADEMASRRNQQDFHEN
jgi:tRNA A37 threonylcarbamoyltransferase TsaD